MLLPVRRSGPEIRSLAAAVALALMNVMLAFPRKKVEERKIREKNRGEVAFSFFCLLPSFAAITLPIVVDFPSCSCQASPVLPSQLETSREFDKFPQKRYGELVTSDFFVGEFRTFLPPQARSIDTCRHSRQGGGRREKERLCTQRQYTQTEAKEEFRPKQMRGKRREKKKLIALVHPVIYQGVATKHFPPSPLFPNSWVGPALGANFRIIYFSRPFRGERKGGRYSNFPTR